MKTLNNRIIKIEKRLSGENGIAAWAMREAEMRARMEPSRIRGSIALNKAMRAAGLEVDDDTPEPRFGSRDAIEAYARELSQKYRNEDEFRNRPIDPEALKRLDDAIEAMKSAAKL